MRCILFIISYLFSMTVNPQTCLSGDCLDGIGTFQYSDGTVYSGEWKNGKSNGQGTSSCEEHSYTGGWKNDEENGFGKYTVADGSFYEGKWKNGSANGYGIFTDTNKTSHIGYWKNGVEHGEGIYLDNRNKDSSFVGIWKNGHIFILDHLVATETKEGSWSCKNGLFNGKGEKSYSWDHLKNGEEYTGLFIKYSGDFKNGWPWGSGIMIYANGDMYTGELVKANRQGQGICTYPDGTKYEGEWKNDEPNGKGVYQYKNGGGFNGIVKDGSEWTGTYTSPLGVTEEIKNGMKP
jgi:hypothetical protein